MLNKIKRLINKLYEYRDFKTNRKIVVIESDDWGMIRMPSKEVYKYLLNKGYPVDENPYCRYDNIESNDDMEGLFEVLASVKDSKGMNAVFTANNIVANPDFDAIETSGFSTYAYEKFTDTLQKYPNRNNVTDLYKEGINSRLFIPQFHGREHINVPNWMQKLREKDVVTHEAFKLNFYSLPYPDLINNNSTVNLDAFGSSNPENLKLFKESIKDGIRLFEEIHKFKPRSFIAPCYTWHSNLEPTLKECGVAIIQGNRKQVTIEGNGGKGYRSRMHFTSEQNNLNQFYTVRNVYFEPFENPHLDTVGIAMSQINKAFKNKNIAIIGSHRVNYIGSIDQVNRSKNLKNLDRLLKKMLIKWPDIEFLSSDNLYNVFKN
jgi:hypothetical protein